MSYNWQQPDWTVFRYKLDQLQGEIDESFVKSAHIAGILRGMSKGLKEDATLELLIAEALKTSVVEGEHLSRHDVMSSLQKNLGITSDKSVIGDRRAKGIADLIVAARADFSSPLSADVLFDWHRKLMAGSRHVAVGFWRTDETPMYVVSGSMDNQTVHFEAPPSARVDKEMQNYIAWFNRTAPGKAKELQPAIVRSAIAHLYFESIHPFEDGNGRIGRAISEKVLSQAAGHAIHLSLSQAIARDRDDYYGALKSAQKSNEVTGWVKYFVSLLLKAQLLTEEIIEFTLMKAQYYEKFRDHFSDRQLKAVEKMFGAGAGGFIGGMNAKKYSAITKTSKATATRDLQYLAKIGALKQLGAGRGTRYELAYKESISVLCQK